MRGWGAFDGTAVLYRLYDHHDRLMWVGITQRLGTRLHDHRRWTWWGSTIVRIRLQVFPTREAARAAELCALAEEGPLINRADTDPSVPPEARLTEEDKLRRASVLALAHLDDPWFTPEDKERFMADVRAWKRFCEDRRMEELEHVL